MLSTDPAPPTLQGTPWPGARTAGTGQHRLPTVCAATPGDLVGGGAPPSATHLPPAPAFLTVTESPRLSLNLSPGSWRLVSDRKTPLPPHGAVPGVGQVRSEAQPQGCT